MDGEGSAPPATGRRVEWGAAPAWLREEVEARLGARVAGAVTQAGGFSPGVAARLRLADGRRVFVKAVGPEPNLDSPAAHRAEARNPEASFATHPAPAGADPRAVTTTLAAWAGFLIGGARLPAPPGLPTLRAFQLGQGVVALDWLRRRTGWS
jgi:hypothetical protein